MLKLCGETEERLAQELIQFEFQIERDVVEPLYVLAEVSQLFKTPHMKQFPGTDGIKEPQSPFILNAVHRK